jgi:hypothetical protein
MSKLEIYRKLLKVQPWFQRIEHPVIGGKPLAYRTYKKVTLVSVDGGGLFTEVLPRLTVSDA